MPGLALSSAANSLALYCESSRSPGGDEAGCCWSFFPPQSQDMALSSLFYLAPFRFLGVGSMRTQAETSPRSGL